MELFDNITKFLINDLKKNIVPSSSISIAASCFSIYAYEALKKELASIKELRFIFTSPTFIAEKEQKEIREVYIPRLNRERSIYGSEYEIKLRNELTQKSIARECADWIREKVKFRSNVTKENMGGFFNIVSAKGRLVWYSTQWQPYDALTLQLKGLNLDDIYENFVRQIAGKNLPDGESLQADVERESARNALQKRIAALSKKLRSEKQFNRQVEINRELRELKAELAALDY